MPKLHHLVVELRKPLSQSQEFTLRADRRDVLVDGEPQQVGARAFDVLSYLDANRDRVVTKQELMEQVWEGRAVEEGNLSVQISALRKLLGSSVIATVPGAEPASPTASL